MPSLNSLTAALSRRLRSAFVCFGSFKKSEPVNPAFGFDKGSPVDRIYIDQFLGENASAIKGKVLEIGEATYSNKFAPRGLAETFVLSFYEGEGVDYVGRLEDMKGIADESFDCIILVQTLHYVFNMFDALKEIYRVLKPGGTVLCCVPGLSQISRYDMDMWGDRWRLTDLSARELFETQFEASKVKVKTFGNAYTATAFIQGIPAERLRPKSFMTHHPDYQVLVSVVAQK